jgi:hypothetical protein
MVRVSAAGTIGETDISIGAADGVITRSGGLQLPANIGIGTAVNTAQSITFLALYTDTAATRTLSQGAYSMTTTTSQTANIRGYAIGLTLAPAIGTTNSTSSTSSPFYATAYLNGAGTASQLNGLTLFVGLDSAGTGTITASNSLDIYCRRAAAGTIITWKGLNLSESGSSGTITNYWGLYESLGTGAKNYLAHALLIGTTTAATGLLQLASGTTSANGIGFGSDVTLYRSAADTLKTDDSLSVAINLSLAGATVGSSGAGVVAIANGTAPTTSPPDIVQLYSRDYTSGNAGLTVRTESGAMVHLAGHTIAQTDTSGVEQRRTVYDAATGENGVQIKLTNRTGATSVKGTLVHASTSYDRAFHIEEADGYDPAWVVAESGIADGSECWVWIEGAVCQMLLQDSTASTRGNWCKVSDTQAGRIDATNAFPPGGTIAALEDHSSEVGHCMQSKASGTDVLALIYFHTN